MSSGSKPSSSSSGRLRLPVVTATQAKSSSRESGPPERFDLGDFAIQGLGYLASIPGKAFQLPLSIADTLGKFATGNPVSKGLADFFDKTPVGDLTRGAQNLLDMGWDTPGAILNAPTARMLADTSDLSPDTPWIAAQYHNAGPLGDFQNFLRGIPGLGILAGNAGPGAQFNTLGEFRADAEKRGIDAKALADVKSGARDIWSFGKNPISTNPLEDLAWRLVADPTNLFLFGGPKLANLAFKAAGVGGKATVGGVDLAKGLEEAGVWSSHVADLKTAGAAVASGDVAKSSWQGVGYYLKQAARGYAKASLKAYAGLEATDLATEWASDQLGDNTPVGGFLEGLHQLSHEILSQTPLSGNSVYNLLASFHVPFREAVSDTTGAIGAAKRKLTGVGALSDMSRNLAPKGTANAANWLRERLGSDEAASMLLMHVAEKITLKKNFPKYEAIVGSIPEAATRFGQLHDLVHRDAEKALESGRLSGRELAQTFKEWYGEQAGFSPERRVGAISEDTGRGQKLRTGLRFPWIAGESEVKSVQAWQKYAAAIGPVSKVFHEQGDVTLGLTRVVTVENLEDIGQWVNTHAKDGVVSRSDLHDIMLSYPGLAYNSRFWDAAAINASTPVKDIKAALREMKGNAPSNAEIGHEVRIKESEAPPAPDVHDGMVGEDGVRMQPAPMGEATVAFSRMRPELGQQPSSLADVQSMRANPVVRYAEDNIGPALRGLGFNVQKVTQAVGGWAGSSGPELEPSLKAVFSQHATADELRLAAAMTAKAFDQDASLWYARGADRMAQLGVTPNAIIVSWENVPTDRLNEVISLAHRYFGSIGFTIDDTAGEILISAATKAQRTKALRNATRMAEKIGADPEIEQAYSELIFNRARSNTPRDRRADDIIAAQQRTDPRAGAYGTLRQAVANPGRARSLASERGSVADVVGEAGTAGVRSRPEVTSGTGVDELRDLARRYVADHGLGPLRERELHPGNADLGARVAQLYHELPAVGGEDARRAYEVFAKEIDEQWDLAINAGYTIEPWKKPDQPYANSAEMAADVANNHHLWVFEGGEPHPFLTDEQNYRFRAVHDLFGHAQEGYQFGPRGELNATIKHAQMFSPEARKAMLSETLGQNSFVNYSTQPAADFIPEGLAAPFALTRERGTVDPRALQGDFTATPSDELVRSIAENGIQEPLKVSHIGPGARVGDGHHRLAAALQLGLPEVPVEAQRLAQTVAEVNRAKPGSIYAVQKAALLPDEVLQEFERTYFPDASTPLQPTASVRAAMDGGRELYNLANDVEAERVLGRVVFDPAVKQHFDGEVIGKLALLQHQLEADGLYQLKIPPKIATLIDKSKDGMAKATLLQHTMLGEWLYDRGPLSSVNRFYNWLTQPISNVSLVKAAQQALYNELIPLGASTKEVQNFIGALRKEANRTTILGYQVFRGPTGLPAETIRRIAAETFTEGPVLANLKAKKDDIVRLLDRSSNRFIRAAQEPGANKLQKAIDFAYQTWQKTPFLGEKSRLISKTMYPIFRFILDPRWLMMNAVEADMIGGLKYGIGDTRLNPRVRERGLDAGTATHMTRGRPNSALAQAELDAQVNGGMLWQRHLSGHIGEAFRTQRFKSTEELIDSLPANHEWIAGMAQQLGHDTTAWSKQLDDMLYQWSTKGTKATLRDETAKLLDAQQRAELAPLLDKLYDKHQQLYDDIIQTFTGNHNRSNIERLANSYWLYWPISYQIKATKWLYDVLTKGAFGKDTNLAGAWTFNHLYQEHADKMENDKAYAAMFDDHPTVWFLAQMLMPITPGDIGVSLSRPVRYAGGALGVWGAYKAASDPISAAGAILNLGPVYTIELLNRVGSEIFHTKKKAA